MRHIFNESLKKVFLTLVLVMPMSVFAEDDPSTPSDPGEQNTEQIKIATTKYTEDAFANLVTTLESAITKVTNIVDTTVQQATEIGNLATTKQDRPTDVCPQYKQCLLIMGADNKPHWYEIAEPFDAVAYINTLVSTRAAPISQTHSDNGTTVYDKYNAYWLGNSTWRKEYVDGSTSVNSHNWTTCTGTNYYNAPPCRTVGGAIKTFNQGEWALVYEGTEGTGVTPGIIYGESKCTSLGTFENGSNLTPYSSGGTKLSDSRISDAQRAQFELVPNKYGTTDDPNNPRSAYKHCWCKMTGVGGGGTGATVAEQFANGGVYTSVGSGSSWVFYDSFSSATVCAYYCAAYCAFYARVYASFRLSLLGLGAN